MAEYWESLKFIFLSFLAQIVKWLFSTLYVNGYLWRRNHYQARRGSVWLLSSKDTAVKEFLVKKKKKSNNLGKFICNSKEHVASKKHLYDILWQKLGAESLQRIETNSSSLQETKGNMRTWVPSYKKQVVSVTFFSHSGWCVVCACLFHMCLLPAGILLHYL